MGFLEDIYRYLIPYEYDTTSCPHEPLVNKPPRSSGMYKCSGCGGEYLMAGTMIRSVLSQGVK